MRAIDPIDRIALMEKLCIGKECTVCEQNSDPYCKWKPDVVDVCEAICTAPTIEPRKKGHWIKISPANIYECSECGKNVMTGDISAYDFCHGCGADMREDAEEPKKCDTCKHVKEPWFNRCADCSDFELWEQICEK